MTNVACRRLARFAAMLLGSVVAAALALALSGCARSQDASPGLDASPPVAPSPTSAPSLTATAVATTAQTDPAFENLRPLAVEEAFPGLDFRDMVDLAHAGDGTVRLFVVLRHGVIQVFYNTPSGSDPEVFLDISERVLDGGSEEGLLGLAFAPDYADSGHLFVYYTASNPRRSVVSRFTVQASDPGAADPASEVVLLEVGQPFPNHNGGQIAFGPDGFLYAALGDGGGAGDRLGHGQNPHTLLGTILRLDVTGRDAGDSYRIPSDNPFADGATGRPEVYAYGLRNPWRFSFDPQTGLLWAGDVGQNSYEEVDLVLPGLNYGWNEMEGFHCYPTADQDCGDSGLTRPVVEYGRSEGCSVTGGHVYRGERLPSLFGAYVYGDFCSGKIWALRYDGAGVTEHILLADTDLRISAFGIGPDGELYILDYGQRGRIYRFAGP